MIIFLFFVVFSNFQLETPKHSSLSSRLYFFSWRRVQMFFLWKDAFLSQKITSSPYLVLTDIMDTFFHLIYTFTVEWMATMVLCLTHNPILSVAVEICLFSAGGLSLFFIGATPNKRCSGTIPGLMQICDPALNITSVAIIHHDIHDCCPLLQACFLLFRS